MPQSPRRGAAQSRLAALVVCLGFGLAAGGGPLAAQEPDSSDELILQLHIERGPERTVTAFGDGVTAFIPLRVFLEMTEIRMTEVIPGRRIAGVLEPGAVPYWFDTETGTRGRTGLTAALTRRDYLWRGEELYVAAPLVGEVFGVVFRMDWGELSITVADASSLPVRRRLDREARRQTVLAAAQRIHVPRAPIAPVREPLADGAVVDYSLQLQSQDPEHNYTFLSGLGLAVAGGNFTYLSTLQRSAVPLTDSTTGYQTTHTGRVSWTRAWPERRVIRQLRAGDTFLEGQRPRTVRGVAVTNVPFLRPSAFGVDRFSGWLGPDWELELSSGGQLLGYATTDSAGRYVLRVPLGYGPNPTEVRAFGPGGQELRWARAFSVSFERLPARHFEYLLGGGECQAGECRHMLVADARYGLSRRVTVRSGVEGFSRDSLGETWHPYAALAAGIMPALALSLEATLDALAAVRTIYNPHPDLSVEAGHARFAQGGAQALFGGVNTRHRSDGNLFWRPGGGRLQLELRASRTVGLLSTTSLSVAPSLRLSSVTARVAARRTSGSFESAVLDASLNGVIGRWIPILGRSLLQAAVQSSCGVSFVNCETNIEVRQVQVGIGRQLGAVWRIDALANWQRDVSTIYTLTVTSQLPYLRSVTRTGYNPAAEYVTTQVFEGSVLWDRRGGRLAFDDGRSVGFAGIRGVVFYDSNGNGRQDGGEDGVPEALVRVGSRGVITDSLGRFASFELPPFERAIVEVDTLGLRDPTWLPAVPAVAVRPAPNGFSFVPMPLVQGVELSGAVTLDGRPLGQLQVRARNAETGVTVILTTFEDGTFYSPAMRPGEYELTIAREVLERLRAFFAPQTVTIRHGQTAPTIRLELVR